MITIERFFFNSEEALGALSMNADTHPDPKTNDYAISFVATEDDPIYIDIKIRGREDFKKLITEIYEVGMSMVEATNESEGTAQVGPVAGGAAQDPNTLI